MLTDDAKITKAQINFNGRTLYDLLGGENVETDSIAIAEQIKNAKDANAKHVLINFSKMHKNIITIEDNGNGMDLDEIHNHWLTIGTQVKLDDNTKLGGKGIGRFSLFRLADTITVETTKQGSTYTFTIDKNLLEENNLTDIVINEELAEDNTLGTKIVLTNISKYINLQEIEFGIENLVHPSYSKIHEIIYPSSYQKQNYILSKEWLDLAPFYAEATIEGMNIKEYRFKCNFKGNVLYQNDKLNKNLLSSLNDLLASKFANDINLGEIKIVIHNFFFDRPYLSWHTGIDRDKIKNEMLEAYQGLSIYRNGYKIYGHGDEDWLKLAELRLQRPGDNIDNKTTYGLITLDPINSSSLKEKTNREGFIKSREYTYFYETILCIVRQVGLDRRNSIRIIRDIIKNEKDKKPKDPKGPKGPKNPIEAKDPKGPKDPIEAKDPKGPKDPIEPKNPEDPKRQKPNPSPTNKIIDASYGYHKKTPQKIKDIIEELKVVTNRNINSQALLLRCLIDISTQYYQKNNNIKIKPNNLPANIRLILNIFNDKKLLDHKATNRVRQSINKDSSLQYFNGVAHDYDYRPNFTDLKELWNTFEAYITVCINP